MEHVLTDEKKRMQRTCAIWFFALFALMLVPFFLCSPLPLSDYPNHLARMYIIANLPHSAELARYYSLDWSFVPNLAMDLIVPRFIPPLSAEAATWLFTATALFLMASGAIALHRALYGDFSPAPFAAFLLLYNRHLLWGFLNYLFAVGLALWLMALYMSLRQRPAVLRIALFSLLSTLLMVAHLHAFASYAILVGGYEISIAWTQWRRNRFLNAGELAAGALQFVAPVILFLAFSKTMDRAGESRFGNPIDKIVGLLDLFNNYSLPLDAATFALFFGLATLGLATRRLRLHRMMILPLAILSVLYVAIPHQFFSSYGADRRLLVLIALVAVAAMRIEVRSHRAVTLLAASLGLLLLARTAVVGINWMHASAVYAPVMQAIDQLRPGSRVVVLYGCKDYPTLQNPPLDHLANMAVVKKNVYINSLFAEPGQQPLRVVTGFHEKYSVSPSQTFRMRESQIGTANPFSDLPLERFDYVLMINPSYFVKDYPQAMHVVFEKDNVRLFMVTR
jgi:hypothetical protein